MIQQECHMFIWKSRLTNLLPKCVSDGIKPSVWAETRFLLQVIDAAQAWHIHAPLTNWLVLVCLGYSGNSFRPLPELTQQLWIVFCVSNRDKVCIGLFDLSWTWRFWKSWKVTYAMNFRRLLATPSSLLAVCRPDCDGDVLLQDYSISFPWELEGSVSKLRRS